MTMLRSLAFVVLAGSVGAHAQTAASVLARMDKAAAAFRAMTGKLRKAEYTAILNDTTVENGEIYLLRSGRKLLMRTEILDPEPRSIGFDDSRVQVYYPKIKTVQIYDLGRQRSLVDQFLVLGFGSSGAELTRNYTVKLLGEEVVDGQRASRLELAPKSAQVAEQIRGVELWIPLEAGHPIQQKFLQPGGDYYLVTYSEVKINPNVPESGFRLRLPPDVIPEYPQK
jgi:outer membrane lipoprotein-sorting protein